MAQADLQTSPAAGETTLQISRLFKAPRDKVYNAWVDPQALSKWWGPEGHTAEIDTLDVRVRLETLCLITVPCEPPCEESDVGDKNPCLCGGD